MSQWKEYCGTNPTDIQNDFPSHVRHASHNLWSGQKYRHRHRLQYPLPLKYGYGNPASVRLLPRNMPLPMLPIRFLRCRHFFHRHLPAFSDGQMPRSYHWYNKFPCCSFHVFQVLYYDTLLFRNYFYFSLSFYSPASYDFLLLRLQHLHLLQVLPHQFQYLFFYS